MPDATVEKYENLLNQDPKSGAFVELARAYLQGGELDKAMAACERGLAFHPSSVVGRVLWGKALIASGKAAEAMKQFDLAMKLDRTNPQAYNLIAEALLTRALYRSALPILRKAVALQPSDARLAQWLEETQAALAGGPAPVLPEISLLEMELAAARTAAEDASTSLPSTSLGAGPSASLGAGPSTSLGASPSSSAGELRAPATDADPFVSFDSSGIDEHSAPTTIMSAFRPDLVPHAVPGHESREAAVLAALESENSRPTTEIPVVVGQVTPSSEVPAVGDAPNPFDFLGSRSEPTQSSKDLARAEAGPPRLLEDVVSAPSEIPLKPDGTHSSPPDPESSDAFLSSPSGSTLLADIPDDWVPEFRPLAPPAPEVSPQAAEAAAREYERELREKLEVSEQKKGFLKRYAIWLALGAVLLVTVAALGGSYFYTWSKNKGVTLRSALDQSVSFIADDTKERLDAALDLLAQALVMDPGNVDALSYQAYAHALLYSEHGGAQSHREAARDIAEDPSVREAHPDLALVIDHWLASEADDAALRKTLLSSVVDSPVVHAEAGRLLLQDKDYPAALKRLEQALQPNARVRERLADTRALVALGGYYLAFEDWEKALAVFSRARGQSKQPHPECIIGQAQSRLELGIELGEAQAELEVLKKGAQLPPSVQGRATLMLGRVLAANGHADEALSVLGAGRGEHPSLSFDFAMAVGQAQRLAGHMPLAQTAFEEALSLRKGSVPAKDALGRVLLARGKERDLLERLRAEPDERAVALLRGIAWWRLKEFKKARAELQATGVQGRVPAEAAVYLALIDAAEQGGADTALAMLERLAKSTKKSRATVQVALARMYLERNALDKAKAVLEEAAKDPQDYEANALLGELILTAGAPPELALAPLERATARNHSHVLSRHLLIQVDVMLGRFAEATSAVEAGLAENPSQAEFIGDAAWVYSETGRIKEAQAMVARLPMGAMTVEQLRVRARVLFALGDSTGAMASLERANKLNPKDARTFCEIGHAFVRQGNNDTALRAYEAAVREDRNSVCGQVGPAHAKPSAAAKWGSTKRLSQLLEKASSAWERAFVYATISRVSLEGRDVEGATAAAKEAMRVAPASPYAWFAQGEIARRSNEETRALQAYGKAVELDASWVQPRLALAEVLARSSPGQLQQAIDQYEAALTYSENESDQQRVKKALAALTKQLRK